MAAISAVIVVAAAVRAHDAMAQTETVAPDTGAKVYHTRFRSDAVDGFRTIEIEGRIRFSDDAARIEWMDEGAYVLIVTDDQGRNVRLRAESNRQGQPAFRYDIDGRENRNAGDIDRWLADALPIVFRELGFDAEARVRTAYEQGGAEAVMKTLAAIRSDYSAGRHYAAYFDLKDVSDAEIIDALAHLGADINADDELTTILYGIADLYYERPAIRTSFLACLEQIDSDHLRTQITRNLFGIETVSGTEPPTMATPPGEC